MVTSLTEFPKRKIKVKYAENSSKPSSELAFDRFVTVLFNQLLNGSIATFFTKIFKRKNVSDMVHPELTNYKSYLYSQMKDSHLNRSERDLLSTLYLCNRDFTKFYGSYINEDWSNVSYEHFDTIGEEYGFEPIDRNVIQKRSKATFETSSNQLKIHQSDESLTSATSFTKKSKEKSPLALHQKISTKPCSNIIVSSTTSIPSNVTTNNCNNNSICCSKTLLRPSQQEKSLSQQQPCEIN